MKHYFVFLFLLSVSVSGFSQTGSLGGIVSSNGEPLELASVVLVKTNFATSADKNGKFEWREIPAGKYQLRVTYIGYENFQTEIIIAAGKTVSVPVELVSLSSKLNEVVITGNLKEVSKQESITPVDVYSTKFFQRNMPLTNLFDALYNINGLFADVDNGVSNTTDVQLNGLEGNYTMFLIDGVPALNGLAGTYALNAFPMSIVDKVEILKGASSTLYGSEAIAGVINIKTKNPSSAPRVALNVALTSKLEVNADFSFAFHTKNTHSFLAISTENMNYKWDVDRDNFMDIPNINRANAFYKMSVNRKSEKTANIYLRYLYENRLGGEMSFRNRERGSSVYYGEAVTTHQWQAGLQYQFPVQENVLLMADVSEHIQNGFYGMSEYKGLQFSGFTQLTWNKKVDARNQLLFGVTYRAIYFKDNTALAADSFTGYPRLAHIGAFFAEDEIAISKTNKLTLGVRLDYSSRSGPVFSPRAVYKWNSPNEKNILRISAGTGYRIPNVVNEGFGAMNGSRTIAVPEKLRAENTINGNINYMLVQQVKSGLLSIDASIFGTYFFNLIEPDYGTDPAKIVFENSKNGGASFGASVFADFVFNYPLKAGFGFTVCRTMEFEKEDDGETQINIPYHQPLFTGNFYLSYSFPAPGISLDWTGNIISPMKLSVVPDDFRPAKSKWFTIQNIQFTKKFRKGVEIYVGIKNIFNFIQKDPILRPFDPFNRNTSVDNPFNYRFDTTYGFTSTQGIKGFAGLRYVLP